MAAMGLARLVFSPEQVPGHVSGIAGPVNGHIDEFRTSDVQRSDGWIETSWNNTAGTEQQEGGEPPPLAGASVVVWLTG